MPLIEPLEEDTFYLVWLWDWLELLEVDWAVFYHLSRRSRICFSQLLMPPPGATALAMLSLMSGLVDIMTNILDNYQDEGKWGIRAKTFLQVAILVSAVVFIGVIASFPYSQPGCWIDMAEA